MKALRYKIIALALFSFISCEKNAQEVDQELDLTPIVLIPSVITEPTPHDTDDPAIWIHPSDPTKSLVIGTDKRSDGGIYAFDLEGKIVNKILNLNRPNNVDVAYGFKWDNQLIDIAVVTERKANSIRVFRLPDLLPIDDGGIKVFVGEGGNGFNEPMGIGLYTKDMGSESKIYAIVGRKSGPLEGYLWQYELYTDEENIVKGNKVRSFGMYSGTKEIEAIAVDNELGYVYYSDELVGVHKYYADPTLNDDSELVLFAQNDRSGDLEGIAIYLTGDRTGYILVSDQKSGSSFLVYPREGASGDKHQHELLATVLVSTVLTHGADATNVNLGSQFPEGMLVAMTDSKEFHYYDWRNVQLEIDKAVERGKLD